MRHFGSEGVAEIFQFPQLSGIFNPDLPRVGVIIVTRATNWTLLLFIERDYNIQILGTGWVPLFLVYVTQKPVVELFNNRVS